MYAQPHSGGGALQGSAEEKRTALGFAPVKPMINPAAAPGATSGPLRPGTPGGPPAGGTFEQNMAWYKAHPEALGTRGGTVGTSVPMASAGQGMPSGGRSFPGFDDLRGQTLTAPTAPRVAAQDPDQAYAGLDTALKQSFSPEQQKLRDMSMTSLGGLSSAPNRATLASRALQLMREQTAPAWEQDLRRTGQMAAALGRTGSGMTTNELTDLTLAREKALGQFGEQAAIDSADKEMADRLSRFDRTAGYEGQVGSEDRARAGFTRDTANNRFDIGSAIRGQNVGERDFQYGTRRDATSLAQQQQGRQDSQAQQAIENARNREVLQDALLNSQFGRQSTAAQLAAQYGFSGAPFDIEMQGADARSRNAGAQSDALAEKARSDAFQKWLATYGKAAA